MSQKYHTVFTLKKTKKKTGYLQITKIMIWECPAVRQCQRHITTIYVYILLYGNNL